MCVGKRQFPTYIFINIFKNKTFCGSAVVAPCLACLDYLRLEQVPGSLLAVVANLDLAPPDWCQKIWNNTKQPCFFYLKDFFQNHVGKQGVRFNFIKMKFKNVLQIRVQFSDGPPNT